MMLLMVLFLGACRSEELDGCDRPPKEGFSESDLIGTWSGDIEDVRDSTIIVRSDGRYKQIIDIKRTGFQYEGNWQPWHITYSERGLPYLHLEGLLMCAYWDQIDCTTGQTGIEPFTPGDTKDPFGDATYWRDVCQKKWVNTPGEGVFMVWRDELGSRGIMLVPFTKSPDMPTGPYYELEEPGPPTSTLDHSSTFAVQIMAEPKSTPDLTHCISAPLDGEAQAGVAAPLAWNDSAEPKVAQAAPDRSCIAMGEGKFVKHLSEPASTEVGSTSPGLRRLNEWLWWTLDGWQ